jgi:hypothetical protein
MMLMLSACAPGNPWERDDEPGTSVASERADADAGVALHAELSADAGPVELARTRLCSRAEPCERKHLVPAAASAVIAAMDPALRDAWFRLSLADASQLESGGQFVYFAGGAGLGALYAAPGSPWTPIYGDFLSYWSERGYEQSALGYPHDAEHDARDSACLAGGAAREQAFSAGPRLLCWSPVRGVWPAPP